MILHDIDERILYMNYESVPLRDFKELNDWDTVIFVYKSALKQVRTKIDILNDEFQHRHKYNPIEHIKYRIKTPESIVKKLKRHGYDSSIENMVRYVNDIAGIRISCSFTSDIYLIADMLSKQNDLTILARRDYMKNPKRSGYSSVYHFRQPGLFNRKIPEGNFGYSADYAGDRPTGGCREVYWREEKRRVFSG